MLKEVHQHNAVFVGRLLDIGGHSPVIAHFLTVKESGFDVGIANVEGEDHPPYLLIESLMADVSAISGNRSLIVPFSTPHADTA